MPLNINDREPEDDEQGIPPIKHSPKEQRPVFTNTTLLILLVAILASGVFLLYKYRVLRPGMFSGKVPASAPSALPDPWKNASPAVAAPSGASDSTSQKRGESTAPKPETHQFAVYIASYRTRSDAEEEVSRWVAAGFSSFVADAGPWHRVAFGGYDAAAEASEKAERWKQAFENGYWIGRLN